MLADMTAAGARSRVLITRLLSRIGFKDSGFLLLMAVLIGVITAAAAVGFHRLTDEIRDLLYRDVGSGFLYGGGMPFLIIWPALGGVTVGILVTQVFRAREGHGVIDVMESVIRSSGFVRPGSAVEKIVTSAVTIGSGGSAGAEGPIVQIGAAISSLVGKLFDIPRQAMPALVGCGTAAGISAIFNSPMGGLMFTLEVILQDFSMRTITPVVVASVVANVTTQAIFRHVLHRPEGFSAIFNLPGVTFSVTWPQLTNFAIVGLACGMGAVCFTKLAQWSEEKFHEMPGGRLLRPGIGGALLGVTGVVYVAIFGQLLLGQPKPISFEYYPMPSFYGDGYGAIQQMLHLSFYEHLSTAYLLLLLIALTVLKIVGTCLTISSGGSGGIIAPALFIGATIGGLIGLILRTTHLFPGLEPQVYALVGMSAVLAAVIHAPLASTLILLELTRNNDVLLPAVLASVIATGSARAIMPDSIYTSTLRRRGIRPGSGGGDMMVLRRLTVEQVQLEPAAVLQEADPFQRVLDLTASMAVQNFVVIDTKGGYCGMVVADDINMALLQREAIPLLLVAEIMRPNVPFVRTSDDLATVLDVFGRINVSHLPVCLPSAPGKVIGLVSRAALMRRYQSGLAA